jgi:large subunit ribosomal protein L19
MKKLNKQALLNKVEATQLRTDIPEIKTGDTVRVHQKIVEGVKTRIQKLEGTIIRVRGGGLRKTFILRRETVGVASEITFNTSSPLITKIEVVKVGKVRRNYISYMRARSGKSARIKSDFVA